MAKPNGHGGWDLTDEDAQAILDQMNDTGSTFDAQLSDEDPHERGEN